MAAAPGRIRFTRAALSPAPTGKVWYLDPVNGKTPAAGGDGSQTAPWNSLTGVLSFKFPSGYTRPLLSSVPYFHVVDGKRVYVADQLGSPPVQPGDTIMLMSGNYGDIVIGDYLQQVVNPSFRHSRGRAGPDAGVLDPVHPLDQ